MSAYLLDSNTLIYGYREQGQCRARMEAVGAASIVLTSVVVFEIEYGIAKSSNPRRLRNYLDGLTHQCMLLAWDNACAAAAAGIRATLERQGRPIGHYDTLIAGCAMAHDLTVVTHNTREFSRIAGLRVEDWYA